MGVAYKDVVAVELIRPYVVAYLEAENRKQYGDNFETLPPSAKANHGYPPSQTLALAAGIHFNTLDDIVHGRLGFVRFATADAIICAMGDATLWYKLGDVERVSKTITGKNGFEFRDVYWNIPLTETCAHGHAREEFGYRTKPTEKYPKGQRRCRACDRIRVNRAKKAQRERLRRLPSERNKPR